jgi:hypothetical protein
MTVIAWDGKTLAADKLACNGQTKTVVTKIARCGNELIGVCGDLSIGMELRDWYARGAAREDYPASNRDPDKGASLIVIRANGECWKYESSPAPFKQEAEHCAFGSGSPEALVAMACGKTAAEAVALASRFNTSCGMGVDAIDLR